MNSSTLYTGIAVILALVVVVLFFFYPNYLSGLGLMNSSENNNPTDSTPSTAGGTSAIPTSDSLQIQDTTIGTGATAQAGDQVSVEYVGKLADGTIFDQSSAHSGIMPGCSKPNQFCFTLGAGQVIQGWDRGVLGMKVGGVRTLIIPPMLAYGSQGVGPIPPNATLTFEVKLLSVNHTASNDAQFVPSGPAAN